MRKVRGRARIETCVRPAARQLERSLTMFRHLRNEDSSVSREKRRDWEGKHMLHTLPPIRGVQSPRAAHHPLAASLNGQVDDGDNLRVMSQPRHRRLHVAQGSSA